MTVGYPRYRPDCWRSGIDRQEVTSRKATVQGKGAVEVVLSRVQAAKPRAQGVDLAEKQVAGQAVSKRFKAEAASGFTVFRPDSEPGGRKDEMVATAATHPDLAKLVVIGKTVMGQDIVAVKVTRKANRVRDGFPAGGTIAFTPRTAGRKSTGDKWFHPLEALVLGGVATDDTVLLGFGVQQLKTQAERADVLGRAVGRLLPWRKGLVPSPHR